MARGDGETNMIATICADLWSTWSHMGRTCVARVSHMGRTCVARKTFVLLKAHVITGTLHVSQGHLLLTILCSVFVGTDAGSTGNKDATSTLGNALASMATM